MKAQTITEQHAQLVTNPDSYWLIWWKLLRPHTLTASFIPVFTGTVIALPYSNIRISLFLSMLVACMLIQSATNMFNEYYDFVRGLDNAKSVGIGGTIVREGVAPKTVLILALSFVAIAMLLGLYLSASSSWWLLSIGLVCILIGYLYSGGPYPISATPFGEVVSGLTMGLVIILISFFIQTGTVTYDSMLISLPTSILIGAILMANNIRDLDGDKLHGRRTLAILLGRKQAITCLAGMFILAYTLVFILLYLSILPVWSLLTLISLPKAIQAIKGFQGKTLPDQMMPAMVATAQTNTVFGLLLSIGLLIQYLIYR